MNFACSIALSTIVNFAGDGRSDSSADSLRADRIVAASSSAYFRSSVMGFSGGRGGASVYGHSVVHCSAMPSKKEYKVGDRIQISLNNRIMDAVIRAVVEQTDGLSLQVDFGNEQTALIHEWQVVKDS